MRAASFTNRIEFKSHMGMAMNENLHLIGVF